jgi:hypothetical protein
MDICKMGTDLGTDSETIQAECELIQKQWATNHSEKALNVRPRLSKPSSDSRLQPRNASILAAQWPRTS